MGHNSRGVTLTELLVAMTILTVAILSSMGGFKYITKSIHQSRTKTIANNIIQEKMEVLKNYSYFQLLVTSATTTNSDYTPSLVYDNSNYPPETITLWGYPTFTRAVHVAYAEMSGGVISTVSYSSNDTGLKQIITYILWKDGDTYKKIEIRNLLANPAAATLNSGFKGAVTISGTATALAGAQVKVLGSPQWRGASDAAGDYRFDVGRGTYSLSCSSAGYYTQTVNSLVASRGVYTPRNFSLVAIGSGTLAGQVWISTGILISQVVASTNGANGGSDPEVEYIELYNPTTYAWTINSSNLEVRYRNKNSGPAEATIPLTFNVTSMPSKGYYLIASTSPVTVLGTARTADAVYITQSNVIIDDSDGGVGIRKDALSPFLDRIAWSNDVGGEPPADLTETTAVLADGGLDDGEAVLRYTSTGSFDSSLGNSYDTDRNNYNLTVVSTLTFVPRNSAVTQTAVSGRPAHGAFVIASDGLSSPVQAQGVGVGTFQEYAQFSLPRVATGTWTVTITSGSYSLILSTAVVTQGATTYIPNSVTRSSWPLAGYNAAILSSTTSGGFIQGYVYGSGADYSVALGGILIEAGGVQTRTASNGYYLFNVPAGAVTVNANFNLDNLNYATDSREGTVTDGAATFIPPNPYFHLPQAGTITGYVTAGTGALPNIVVKAVRGVVEFAAPSDSTGRFYITASTSSSNYTVSPVLDPLQTYSSAPSDPLTAALTVPGSTVFAGTITVTGGMGTISGSVKDGTAPITTGVLIIASIGSISDPPPAIYGSSAPALANPYYTASSQADGNYSFEVRGGTYNMRAYYPIVNTNAGTVSFPTKTKAAVIVNAGAATTGQDFTGSW